MVSPPEEWTFEVSWRQPAASPLQTAAAAAASCPAAHRAVVPLWCAAGGTSNSILTLSTASGVQISLTHAVYARRGFDFSQNRKWLWGITAVCDSVKFRNQKVSGLFFIILLCFKQSTKNIFSSAITNYFLGFRRSNWHQLNWQMRHLHLKEF